MASTAISLYLLRPLSSAAPRPKSKNPNLKPSSHRNPNPKYKPEPKPKPNLKTLIASEATTFTRLPPKDEDGDFSSSNIIKLQDSIFPIGFDSKEEEDDETLGFGWDENDDELVLDLGSDSSDEVSDIEEVFEEIDDDEEEDKELKEKGVSAVMRCFDRAKIYVKAGNGGNGVVAFRREKFVPFGGPSGGDGGRGGNVYVEVDGSMNSLLPFRKNVHFRAGRGSHGQGRKMAGAKGEDVVVKVAPGTIVRDAKSGEVLLELMSHEDRALLLPGGRGGRGNASFKSGTNKVPKIAENGEEGAEMYGLCFDATFVLIVEYVLIFEKFFRVVRWES